MNTFRSQNKLAVMWVIIGVLGRLIPHVPNVTPLNTLSLFAGSKLSRLVGFISLFATLIISDIILSCVYGYPIFSYWTLFTYSAFALIVFLGTKVKCSWKTLPFYFVTVSGGFWLWTNFGVWLTSGIYPTSFSGLTACYVAALPFLRNALVGDLLWGYVIFGSFQMAKRKLQKAEFCNNL